MISPLVFIYNLYNYHFFQSEIELEMRKKSDKNYVKVDFIILFIIKCSPPPPPPPNCDTTSCPFNHRIKYHFPIQVHKFSSYFCLTLSSCFLHSNLLFYVFRFFEGAKASHHFLVKRGILIRYK